MTKTMMTAAAVFAAVAATAAVDHGKANVCFDRVVLENAYLKMTVDRKSGGTARSVIDKADGRELAWEYLTDKGWNGAFGRDRCIEEKRYPDALQYLHYTGEKTVSNGVQTLTLTASTKDWPGIRIGNWTFTKRYTLEPDAKRFRLDFTVTNPEKEERWFSPWATSIVNNELPDTVYAAKGGVTVADRAHDFFNYPERNWLVACDRTSGKSITFTCEWNQLLSQYWCWWNACHCNEWVYMPRTVKPGESYTVSWWCGVTTIPALAASVTPDGAVTWAAENGKLAVTFAPTRFGKLSVQPYLNGKKLGAPLAVDAKPDTPVRLALPSDKLPAAGSIELEIAGSPKYFEKLGNRLGFEYDLKKGPETVKPRPWKRAPTAFGKVGSTDVPARKVLDGIYETSPLRKVFKDDRMDDGKLARDCRLIRGGRFNWQFTIVNTNKRANAVYRITPGYLTDGKGACIPLRATEVKWITIDLPTMFDHTLKVGDYPDPLVPLRNDRLTVAKGENQSFFVECDVPYDAPTGKYTGRVTVRSGGVDRTIDLACEVTDVTLPKQSYCKSTAGVRIPRQKMMDELHYGGTGADFALATYEAFLRNRVTPRECGIRWGADEKTLAADIQDYIDAGATTFYIPTGYFRNPESDLVKKIIKVLREKKQMDRAHYYIMDEPSQEKFPALIAEAKKLHALYPDLRILCTCYDENVEDLFGSIDIWCRGIWARPWQKARREAGDEFMSSNLGCMNLEDPLAGAVSQFCYMKTQKCAGFLYWSLICGYGNDNPWERIAVSGSNGCHGHILFPYETGPIETIRWKALGYGIELFDLITMLDKLADEGKWGMAKKRDAIYERLNACYKTDLKTEDQLESLRSQLIDALD